VRPESEIDGEGLAREVAARSFTLLRNAGDLLPMAADTKVALIGGLAKEARVMGGGSAQVFPDHIVSPFDGLTAAGMDVTFARGADPSTKLPAARFALTVVARAEDGTVLAELPQPGGSLQWIGQMPGGIAWDALHDVTLVGSVTSEIDGEHRFAIEGVGAFQFQVGGETLFDGVVEMAGDDPFGAFFSQPQTVFPVDLKAGQEVVVSLTHPVVKNSGMSLPMVAFTLAHREPTLPADQLIEEAVRAAAAADIAVVVVGTSQEVESEGFDRTSLGLPGRQDELVTRVAAANPQTIVVVNAGSPVEMPWRDDVAGILLTWFPGQEGGHALADVLLGHAEPGGRLPTTWPASLADCPVSDVTPVDGVLRYDEEVFIGYRAWARSETAPAFEFGSGLGYTTWSYEKASYTDGTLTVQVRNTGSRPGREVVQAYLAPVTPDAARPARWLAGFAVADAAPGGTTTVTIDVPRRSAEIWAESGWTLVPGDYVLEIGHSLTGTTVSAPLTF
jgi:beta-glucosidase